MLSDRLRSDRTKHQVSYPNSRSESKVAVGVRKLGKKHQTTKLGMDRLTYRCGVYTGNIKPLANGLSRHPTRGNIKKKSPEAKTFNGKATEYSGENDFSRRRLHHLRNVGNNIPVAKSGKSPKRDNKPKRISKTFRKHLDDVLNVKLESRINPKKLNKKEANLHFRLHQGHRVSSKSPVTIKVMKSKVMKSQSSNIIRKYPSSSVNES